MSQKPDNTESIGSTQPDPKEVRLNDFAWHVHAYINDFIRLADAKAGALLAVSVTLIGFLVDRWSSGNPNGHDKPGLFWVATGLDAFVLIFSLLVVAPRRTIHATGPRLVKDVLATLPLPASRERTSLIYWEEIKNRKRLEYQRELSECSAQELSEQISAHCYDLSRIASSKYLFLRFAFVTSPFALAASLGWIAA